LKISILGPVYPYRGGIAQYTTLLARALQGNHQIEVVTFRRQYPAWLYPGKSDKDPSLGPPKVTAKYILDPFYPWTWFQAVRQVKRFAPDVVVVMWWTTFWAPAFWQITKALKRWNIPATFLVHNVFPHETKPWDRIIVPLTLKQGRAFITQSKQESQRLLDLLPHAIVTLCAHPVYSLYTEQRIPKNQARKRLNLPEEGTLLLCFGIVRPYKGIKVLLSALGFLQKQGIQPRLIVAGEFWDDKNTYLELINKLNLDEQVILHDYYIPDNEVGAYFSAADIFIAPYTGGTQSGAVTIAIGFGLPIIISDTIADSAKPSSFRYLIPPDNPDALAQAIGECLQILPVKPTSPIGDSTWDDMVKTIENLAARIKGGSN
jgi:D-inositol-3-phosphate glycosyltransferase